MNIKKTARGFELIEFKDAYGFSASLQQSSAAENDNPGTSYVWLGCDENHFHEMTKEPLSPRMHLDKNHVTQLVSYLQNWLERGTFEPKK